MTREEARKVFLSRGYIEVEGGTIYDADKWREACVVISEWLEQEPCEDTVSRQSAIFLADDLKQDLPDDEHIADMVMAHNEGILEYQTQLSLLPPVTPQQKIGHWIDDKCSICGKGIEDLIDSREWYRNEDPNFCPFCGANMVEPQESEEV